jgi:hypothetical protein
MSFRNFTLPKAQQDFGLTTDTSQRLFTAVVPVPLSEPLRPYLDDFQPLGMSIPKEKGRSELLVAPLLGEVWRRSEHRISLYLGVELNVDEAVGLNGVCDFLLGRSTQLFYVEAPVVAVVEAKKDSIPDGLGSAPLRWSPYSASIRKRTGHSTPSMAASRPGPFGVSCASLASGWTSTWMNTRSPKQTASLGYCSTAAE